MLHAPLLHAMSCSTCQALIGEFDDADINPVDNSIVLPQSPSQSIAVSNRFVAYRTREALICCIVAIGACFGSCFVVLLIGTPTLMEAPKAPLLCQARQASVTSVWA